MKKQISNIQFDSFIYFIMHSCFVGISINNLFFISKQNTPISILFAIIIGLVPIFIFLYIMNYKPNLSIIELNQELFGRKIALILNLLLLGFVLSLAVTIFYNLCNFINSQYLYRTPVTMIGIIFAIGIWYMLSKGLPTFARVIMILLYIDIFLYLLSFIGLVGQVDINNLRPFMDEGLQPIVTGSLHYVAYNILPIFLLTIIPKDQIKKDRHFNQHVIYSYLITNVMLFIIAFCTLSILGIELCQLYQYAEFHILKRVSILGFITRVENTLSIQWIFDMLITCAIAVYFVENGIKRIWHTQSEKNEKIIYTVLLGIIFFLSEIIFPTNTDAYQFLSKVYPVLLYIFFFLVPLGIMLKIFYTEKKKS